MTRTILMVGIAVALAGCETLFIGSLNDCGGRGHKYVDIEYGDGYLIVDPVKTVNKKKELRFRLKGANRSDLGFDYNVADVETEGKSAGADDDWLNAKGSEKPDRFLMVCVDEGLEEKAYNYSVTVFVDGTANEISGIDPRVIVEH
ncbi:MAG: hypothetical protein AAFN50_04755 [Pseudomonadota bacterium]